VIRRTLRLVVTLFVVSVLSAFLIDLLPGDPVFAIGGTQDFLSGANRARLRHDLHLDRPVPVRYAKWVWGAVHGDLGTSYRSSQPVGAEIARRLPVTVELMIVAEIMAIVFALIAAPLSAYKRGTAIDHGTTALSFALLSLPTFILGLLLIYLFAVTWHVFPATGFTPLSQGLWPNLKSVILPAVTLAAGEAAVFTRLLRAEMAHTLQEDFVLVAYAKGLRRWRVLLRHALRPSSLPLITLAGLSVGALIGGSVIVETLFTLPGVGQLAINSVLGRDFIMMQGIVALTTVSYVVINYAVDLLYYVVDPRIRRGSA
jgi:peptide/nickel transport system permease protein